MKTIDLQRSVVGLSITTGGKKESKKQQNERGLIVHRPLYANDTGNLQSIDIAVDHKVGRHGFSDKPWS